MDPVLKIWLYEHWQGDYRDEAELAKNHAYLIGSFVNPEAVSQMMNANTHESSDEDYEESLRMVKDFKIPEPSTKSSKKKHKRRKLISG